MDTYKTLLATYGKTGDGLALENAINDAFQEKVTKMLECEGYEVKGIISIHQDYSIPYLWHIVDKTHCQNFTVDFIFNAKKETINHKYEEVSVNGNF